MKEVVFEKDNSVFVSEIKEYDVIYCLDKRTSNKHLALNFETGWVVYDKFGNQVEIIKDLTSMQSSFCEIRVATYEEAMEWIRSK